MRYFKELDFESAKPSLFITWLFGTQTTPPEIAVVPPADRAFSNTTTLSPFFNAVIAPTNPVPAPITTISVSPCHTKLLSLEGFFELRSRPVPIRPIKLFKKKSLLLNRLIVSYKVLDPLICLPAINPKVIAGPIVAPGPWYVVNRAGVQFPVAYKPAIA